MGDEGDDESKCHGRVEGGGGRRSVALYAI